MIINPTTLNDLDQVRDFESAPQAQGYVYQWTVEQHQKALERPDTLHFCLRHEGAFAGYGIINGLARPDRVFELMRIVVLPGGKGLGRLAMEAVLRHCFDDLKAEKVWLDVAMTNERAICLYENLGFTYEGELPHKAMMATGPVTMKLFGMTRARYTSLTIALAQIAVLPGNLEANGQKHLHYIKKAAGAGARLIVFPELSLTGYELEIAHSLAVEIGKGSEIISPKEGGLASPAAIKVLGELREACMQCQITAVVGLPVRDEAGFKIGSLILNESGRVKVYAKQHLHGLEKQIFQPGDQSLQLSFGPHKVHLAICADSMNEGHWQRAHEEEATLYLASVLISKGGYEHDAAFYAEKTKCYGLTALMANFIGTTGGYDAAGKSAVWSPEGRVIQTLLEGEEGLLCYDVAPVF